jgi:hypothetical protein
MADMQFVSSSNVEQVGYDDQYSELHVRFRNTAQTYVYLSVPRSVFDDLMAAPSKGTFLHQNVYKNYQFEKR